MTSLAELLAHHDPHILDDLSIEEKIIALGDFDLWLRPEQRVPSTQFGSFGEICGRGWGKTTGLAPHINERVMRGVSRSIGLMAPNDDRVAEVQIANLISHSPPWFRAEEYDGTIRWPNGVVAETHTSMQPGRTRSSNFDCIWLTELCDWNPPTRKEAYDNITTACRAPGAVTLWDTTSKGVNEIIQARLQLNRVNPEWHIIRRGSMFDNPFLSDQYLADEVLKYVLGSVRYLEEVEGEVHFEAGGALWTWVSIESNRVSQAPATAQLRLMAWDPALSDSPSADEQGLTEGLVSDGHAYLTHDYSTREDPELSAKRIAERHRDARVVGVVVERNHAGNMPRSLIKLHAERLTPKQPCTVEVIKEADAWPAWSPSRIYIKEYTTHDSKHTRAQAPSAAYRKGRVHHAGSFTELEQQMISWDGTGRSPNRLDSCAYLIADLLGLTERHARPSTQLIADTQKLYQQLPSRPRYGL